MPPNQVTIMTKKRVKHSLNFFKICVKISMLKLRVTYTPHLRFENDTKAASIPNFEWADLRSVFLVKIFECLIVSLTSRTEYYEYFEPENQTVKTKKISFKVRCYP